MKSYLLVLFTFFALFSCAENENRPSPDEVLSNAMEKLNSWETVSFKATTTQTSKRTTQTVYKLKKANYEPHLKLFFFKEMNKEISIFYKLASLVVVEDHKKKITTFDYGNDRSIPKYLDAYMADDDNILALTKLLNQFKAHIVYSEQSIFDGKQAYIYSFQNHKLWLDAQRAIPLKFEMDNDTSNKKEIVYEALEFNELMEDDTFTHENKAGYVSTTFGVKKEPMLHIKAPEWNLLDLNGKNITSNDFRGTPIFLEAWTSSCSHCMASLPKVKQIENEFGDQLKVITVNFDYDLNLTKQAIKTEGINYMVLQGDAVFERQYDLRSFPSYFVINSEGTIVYSERGAIEGRKAEALFEAIRTVK